MAALAGCSTYCFLHEEVATAALGVAGKRLAAVDMVSLVQWSLVVLLAFANNNTTHSNTPARTPTWSVPDSWAALAVTWRKNCLTRFRTEVPDSSRSYVV